MDVEQRMNLSLDDIIKQKSKTSDKSAAKGKPPAISGAKAKTGPAKVCFRDLSRLLHLT